MSHNALRDINVTLIKDEHFLMELNPDYYSELVVICAHPDDECIMAGSLIESFIERGKKVKVLLYSHETQLNILQEVNPFASDYINIFLKPLTAYADSLLQEFQDICRMKGIEYYTLSLPDQKFQFYDYGNISNQVSSFISQSSANSLIVVHHSCDINEDHEVVAKTCDVAFRKHLFHGTAIEGYIHGSTKLGNYSPNIFLDSEQYIDMKLSRFKKYKNQQRDKYHPRSIYALNSIEAFFGTYFGHKYAESYQLKQ